MKKKILLSGASGFVGAVIARRLVEDGHDVHCIVRAESDLWRLDKVRGDLRFHFSDLTDFEALRTIVAEVKPDWVFHLAVNGGYSWQADWQTILRTNVFGTASFLEACAAEGFECFINTGSSSEYGYKPKATSESDECEPNSYYSVAKLSATLYARFVAQSKKLRVPTLRLYSVYGPFEDSRRLIPTILTHAMDGKLPVLVSPLVARDFIFVEDIYDAFIRVAQHTGDSPAEIYNVCSARQTTIGQLVDAVRTILPVKEEPVWNTMENRNWDTTVWVGDNSKLRGIGWEPRVQLIDGLQKTVEWLRNSDEAIRYRETISR